MNQINIQQKSRLIASLTLLAFISLGLMAMPQVKADDKASPQAITVSTVTAKTSAIPRTMMFSGPVVGRDEVPIFSDLEQGRIDKVLVDAGKRVKAGEVLATVDAAYLRIQKAQQQANKERATAAILQQETALEEAQAQYEQAQIEHKRADAVARTGLISREALEQKATAEQLAKTRVQSAKNALSMAQADLNLATAQMAESDLRLNQTAIRSPVAGLVVERKAHTGMSLAQNSEPLFNILRDDDVEVELEVSADDATRLKVGMPASLQLVGDNASASKNDTRIYKGKISRAATQINRQNQIAKVRVRFDQTPNFILGQFARVTITNASRDGIYLPDTAVRFEGASAYVFTVSNGVAKRLAIKTGQHIGNQMEVLEGVSAGMVVVDSAASFLRDGEAVRVLSALRGAK